MRRFLLIALLVMAPAALAQGNLGQATLELSSSVDDIVVSRESTEVFQLSVLLESNNPFDQVQPRQVRIEQVGALPAGWIAQVSPERQTAPIDTPITFTVTIDLTAQATSDQEAVVFKAILVPRGAEGTPIGGQIDPETESDAVAITLTREDPLTREVLENFGPWVWVGLGVLAITVLVLVLFLANGQRPTVSMKSNVTNAVVAPGHSVAVPVFVENLTNNDDTVMFHVAPVQAGWAASLPVPDMPLDGGHREELHLVVTAPKNARPGDKISVGMSANSAQNPKRLAELIIDVTVGDTKEKVAAGDTTTDDVRAGRQGA